MKAPRTRVALLGCGRIARLAHLEVLRRLSHVEVVALADSDPLRLFEARTAAPGARICADYHDAIARADAVIIALPPALHAAAAIAAFRAGKHVYVEKPLAAHLADAAAIAAAWRAAGTIGRVGFNYRYHPLHRAVRAQIRAGRLGSVVAIRSMFTSARREQPSWKRSRSSGGGALLDLGSHHFDLLRFHFGEIALVSALLGSHEYECDNACVQLRLAGGITVQSLFSIGTVPADRWEFIGERGVLILDRVNAELAFEEARTGRLRAARLRREAAAAARALRRLAGAVDEPSYRASIADFIASVRSGRAHGPDIDDGARNLAAIDAAERSATAGGALVVPAPIRAAGIAARCGS